MSSYFKDESSTVKHMALFFSLCLLLACPAAAAYTGEWNQIFPGFITILTSPCPLVTDYYQLGNLPAAFLNAGLCGLTCFLAMHLLNVECEPSDWAGFFLVIAHCFYGLNFLNMWPPVFGILLYCRKIGINFRANLDMAMFSTCFGPFVSELLFRYPLEHRLDLPLGFITLNAFNILMVVILAVFLGFAIPAMLPGAQLLHRGFNLYNGGLAFGLLGLCIYAFLYKTLGAAPPETVTLTNAVYEAHGNSYTVFCNVFFLLVFGCCLLFGWLRNGRSFQGYKELLKDNSHRSDFFQEYGASCVWINLGLYGLMMLAYFDLVIAFTDGVGFTGATCGVTLAAMTFAASGQHPKNVWPILAGYFTLSVAVTALSFLSGLGAPWTLSTQGYINGVAFATGLCPFTGCYNRRIGLAAGVICAIMCTSTSAIHGGFVLYNGGLTAGITAMILLPLVDHYYAGKVNDHA